MYDLLVKNARLYPLDQDAAVSAARTLAVNDGRIAALGVAEDAPAKQVLDAANQLVLPGLVDCHTHALYAGDRMAEHVLKMNGASYAEIARAGGGIRTTVAAVRAASEQQLVEQTLPRLQALRAEGVTCIEIKSGYGLDTQTELKMLRAIRSLRRHIDMDIAATFLGAHAVPGDSSREAYLNEIIEQMLPAVAEEKLADTVDIFVERIAFSPADLQRLFEHAHKLGLQTRVHSDQLSNMGATTLAAESGALSCDHLEYSDETDIAAMAMHGTVAVLLPAAFYFLRETRKPPIELLRKHQVPMAVATDLNPGTAPVASLLTAMHMAGILYGMNAAEILLGVTRHAANALGRSGKIGGLTPGHHADFSIWDLPAPEFLTYQLGGLKPTALFFKGKRS